MDESVCAHGYLTRHCDLCRPQPPQTSRSRAPAELIARVRAVLKSETEKEFDERTIIFSQNDTEALVAMATESIRKNRDAAMLTLAAYVSKYAGMAEFSHIEKPARLLLANWEVDEVAHGRGSQFGQANTCSIGTPRDGVTGRRDVQKNSTSALSANPSVTKGTGDRLPTQTPRVKLVYNKVTRKIDKVRSGDGLVLESFEPSIEESWWHDFAQVRNQGSGY